MVEAVGEERTGLPSAGSDASRSGTDATAQTEGMATVPGGSDPRRRYWATWAIVFSLLLVGFAGTVIALNLTLYSATGFVGSYLSSLARHDVESALTTPGVTVRDKAARDLLAPDALGELSDIRLVDDIDEGAGTHRVTIAFEVNGTPGESEFLVEQTGPRLGLFSGWRFAIAPSSTLEVTPIGVSQFEANDVSVESEGGTDVPVPYAVLTPGVFTLSHESDFLVAEPENIVVLEPGSSPRVDLRAQANPEFVELVQTQLDSSLDACTEQEVLQPTGCPFGTQIANRVEGVPDWSMVQYPIVTIVRGREPGTWEVPNTPGAAHLVVGVRSIFDGTLTTFDEDVPFDVSYLISFPEGGGISIVAQ